MACSLLLLMCLREVQAMLLMNDTGALLRFIQRPNSVDLATGQAALQARGRYSELVALLAARRQPEDALDLLRQLSQAGSLCVKARAGFGGDKPGSMPPV